MLERDLQAYLYENPQVLFPGKTISRKYKEHAIEGRRIDLLFEVENHRYIIELKRHTIRREDIGQVVEYYGRMRRTHGSMSYRMMLVAPHIPKHLSLFLEEIGILCVEVPALPDSSELRSQVSHQALTQGRKQEAQANLIRERSDAQAICFEEIIPPVNKKSLAISHIALRDSLETVRRTFSDYQVVPVRMQNSKHPDLLCFGFRSESQPKFVHVGAWWAFAMGVRDHMPKNDLPNLSVNALPWGLDIAVNSELRPSQTVVRRRLESASSTFDRLVRSQSELVLQAWLKFEHQPRFYHWIPLFQSEGGKWTASSVLGIFNDSERNYSGLRDEAITWIEKLGNLSEKQVTHMKRTNQTLNLAVRFVQPIRPSHRFWKSTYETQIQLLDETYLTLKPLLDFLHTRT